MLQEMSSAPDQVEFTRYGLHVWPPEPYEPVMVTPIVDAPLAHERLSDDLLIVFHHARRLGYLATNDWLDIDQFRMATGRPPASAVYRKLPSDTDPDRWRLKSRYHMKPATSLFKNIVRSPYVMPDIDKPLIHYTAPPNPLYSVSVARYLSLSSEYHSPSDPVGLEYLLLSRSAITRLARGEWDPAVFARSRIGDAQLEVLDRLVDQPISPYTNPDYDFDYRHRC
jgi:hypothetical protein